MSLKILKGDSVMRTNPLEVTCLGLIKIESYQLASHDASDYIFGNTFLSFTDLTVQEDADDTVYKCEEICNQFVATTNAKSKN